MCGDWECTMRRRSCASTRNSYRIWNRIVGTTKKSTETSVFRWVVEERPPGLRRRLAVPDHVLTDAGLTDVDAQRRKFAVNVGSAPKRVFAAQHADQFAHVFRHRWTAGLAVPNLPTPEQAKALTLPANHCGRLDDESAGFPVIPDRTEPGPEKAVSGGELEALDGALEHADLMAQGEDL